MPYMGIDMGSTFIKGVLLRDDGAKFMHLEKSGRDYKETVLHIRDVLLALGGVKAEDAAILATGCGEQCIPFEAGHSGEMSCLIRAVSETETGPCIILDLGGQSGRLGIMSKDGWLEAFDYSEKCASGSGKVLESVAHVLQIPFDQLSEAADHAEHIVTFTVSCAVFAESEAIAAIARGERKEDIVAGYHHAIAAKLAAMLSKHDTSNLPIFATGGMSKDAALIRILGEKIGKSVKNLANPQYYIALGAALLIQNGKLGSKD